jgi:hypothetical protein
VLQRPLEPKRPNYATYRDHLQAWWPRWAGIGWAPLPFEDLRLSKSRSSVSIGKRDDAVGGRDRDYGIFTAFGPRDSEAVLATTKVGDRQCPNGVSDTLFAEIWFESLLAVVG